jgi:hypothetical protein
MCCATVTLHSSGSNWLLEHEAAVEWRDSANKVVCCFYCTLIYGTSKQESFWFLFGTSPVRISAESLNDFDVSRSPSFRPRKFQYSMHSHIHSVHSTLVNISLNVTCFDKIIGSLHGGRRVRSALNAIRLCNNIT